MGVEGDYGFQLQDARDNPDSKYKRGLHVFNENVGQQRDKSSSPGGGNSIARPYRASGHSIGVPTGNYGGFRSLDEPIDDDDTAKDAIDEAIDEIVDHVVANPDRFDTIYYCTNGPGDTLIGMGIFHIEPSTREYITARIKALPKLIARAAAARQLSNETPPMFEFEMELNAAPNATLNVPL